MSARSSKATKPAASGRITNFFKPASSQTLNAGSRNESTRQAASQEGVTRRQGSTSFEEDPTISSPTRQLLRESSVSDASTQPSSMPRDQPAKRQRVVPSSDGEESEDSDGLEDLGSMFRARKPPAQTPQKKKEPDGIVLRLRNVTIPKRPPEMPKPQTYKFSLDRIIEERAKRSSLGDDIIKARKMFEDAQKETPDGEGRTRPSEEEIGSKLGEGQASKLLGALDRKDAWRIEKSWHFFDVDKARIPKSRVAFPLENLKKGWETANLADIRVRRETLVSGFVRDMMEIGVKFSDKILEWMFIEMALESNQDLSFAYYQTLCCLSTEELLHALSSHGLVHIFQLLGGREDALNVDAPVRLGRSSRKDDVPLDYWNIQLVVKYIGKMAHGISSDEEVFKEACKLLGRLALDTLSIGHNFISTINDPDIRYNLLTTLPCVTPRAHLFRRRLALAYLFQDPTYLSKDYPDLVRLQRFARLLKTSPTFEVNNDTDYDELRATICILDIAIDDGPTSGEPNMNDLEVDVLVENFRNMFSKIRDTNAQNLSRTESKDVIERLMFRLRFGVRKREKMNLVVDTAFGTEWAGKGGKTQTKLKLKPKEKMEGDDIGDEGVEGAE
ncbi:unnamed protein product [Tuber melanosporum]|uniref:(Perigord truffle) hypothetical protein n=1 Tax=Tuber melanosporum (strain Mel28) TaxID=656061 RepID=D5GQ42_TUBMM|nr:uncharacterized protein GSTUM_00012190001 [Tuber melanosporum]CAZ86635.1 unnamed protein product [Tuber melanosporum]